METKQNDFYWDSLKTKKSGKMKRLTDKEKKIIIKATPKLKEIDNDLSADEIIESMEVVLNDSPVLLSNNREL